MAEFYILGQLKSASNFHDKSSLFCRYTFQAGPNWTVVSGYPEGQTVSAKLDYDDIVVWAHPLDIHYVTKGLQGWPKLILQVSCLDSIGRSWVVGYGCCSVPTVPGLHTVNVNCWLPAATGLTDKIRQYFLGGSHQLIQSDIFNLGLNRSKLHTQSNGKVEIQFCLVLRNFSQFGVEYK